MKPGDIVEIISTRQDVFEIGDRARLLYQDEDGSWWGDFKINERFVGDGEWCIQPGYAQCTLAS